MRSTGAPRIAPESCPCFPCPAHFVAARADAAQHLEPRYIAMIDAALKGDRVIGMIQPDRRAAVRR
jgi:Lon protease-like protein